MARDWGKARDWDAWNKAQNQLWEDVQEMDKKAKAEGKLVGRYISEGVADGNAIYQVVEVTKRTAHLVHVPLWDAYKVAIIEQMGRKMPLKYVKANITFRDDLADIFANRGE